MKSIRKIAYEKPVIFSIITMILTIGITFIPLYSLFTGILTEQAADYASGFLEQMLVSVVLIILLSKMQLLNPAGFHFHVQQLWIIWPTILIIVLNLLNIIDGTIVIDTNKKVTIVLYILVYLSTGVFEETLCRGVVQTLFIQKWGNTKKGIYVSVLLSSFLFGLFHIVHFFLGHMNLTASIAQVMYATFIGVFMGTCVLRNKSIIPTMLVHAIIDITGDLQEIAVNGGIRKDELIMSIPDAALGVALMSPLLFYGLFILRKCTCKEVVDSEKIEKKENR